jgi:hypothetical protein
MVLKHTTTDGMTNHEVDLHEKTHVVTTEDLEGETVTKKKWGTQQKFVEKLISKEIEKVEDRIKIQKRTIGECMYYNKMEGIEVTQRMLEQNKEKLKYLQEYVY